MTLKDPEYIIDKFVHTFLGYGNFKSDIWFIGMEEGGGNSKAEIELRLKTWLELDMPELADIVDFHKRINQFEYFSKKAKLQNTWSKLIQFQQIWQNQDYDRESIRKIQTESFARSNSNNACIELMPLPSPGSDKWYYNQFFNTAYLQSRTSYFEKLVEFRISKLNTMIEKYKPKLVLFYSFQYLEYWKKISDAELLENKDLEIHTGNNKTTQYLVTKHPVSFLKKDYFKSIAQSLSKLK